MRRRPLVLVLLALLLAACAPARPSGGRDRGLVHVTFLQINDVYELTPVDDGRRGGMARVATLVKEAKRENPNTVAVLAGDLLSPSVMSTFLKGEHMIAALNATGLDLAVFGNHEFDFGPETLAARVGESRFTWLATNVLDRRTGRPLGGAAADALRVFGPVTVGFFGVTTPEAQTTSSPGPDVTFRDPLTVAREAAAGLCRRGVSLVVAITHQDMAQDKALADAGIVDLILGGHEHEPLVAEQGRALITKAGSDARYVVRVDLWLTPAGKLVERSWAFREVSARVAPDPGVESVVRRYHERLDRQLDQPAGRTAVPLDARRNRLRTEETNIGDFVADAIRERLGADVALMNGGGIRTDRIVPAGPLTQRDVHGLLPFANVVVKLRLTGRELRQTLEHGLAQRDREGGGFLQVSGLRLTFDPRRPAGSRLVAVEVGGAPLADDRAYAVAVLDYLYRGGDGFTTFRGAEVLVDQTSGPPLAGIVLDAITARGTIAPETDGRITATRR